MDDFGRLNPLPVWSYSLRDMKRVIDDALSDLEGLGVCCKGVLRCVSDEGVISYRILIYAPKGLSSDTMWAARTAIIGSQYATYAPIRIVCSHKSERFFNEVFLFKGGNGKWR